MKNHCERWRKRKRALGHKRQRPERSGQHTQFNVRIGMHSKPSRTPGNVSRTVLCNVIFLLLETTRADLNCAGEARAMSWKPLLLSQILETTFMRTREHPEHIDGQTTPSWNPNPARWLGAPTFPSVTMLISQSGICDVGRLGVWQKEKVPLDN